jgi:signal transduction histidine kinase
VLLTVARSGKEFRCCVIDNGYGIAGEELPKLFDRFQRFDRENERKVRSTGLGLALVKAAADLHGGRVEVESKEGKGSRFCLVLNANSS